MTTKSKSKKALSANEQKELLGILKARFEKNKDRHKGLDWSKVQAKIEGLPAARRNDILNALQEMEDTGGEPDVVLTPTAKKNKKSDEYFFYDCAAESPKGRRSICYDHQALESRKEHKPKDSAINMAEEMGITMLTEDEYRELQEIFPFDTKTSSWVQTPASIRKLGGAIFCDRRFNHVFTYHNGAESYYGARGFRGWIKV